MFGKMYPHRDIYINGKTMLPVEVSMYASKKVRATYNAAVVAGLGFLLVAFLGLSINYFPLISSEVKYAVRSRTQPVNAQLSEEQLLAREKARTQRDIGKAKAIELTQKEATEHGVNSFFSVVIPKIDAKANVVANVDTANEESYETALSKGIGHAAGTNFPGSGEGIFLFSHSTDFSYNVSRYNAIFYLLRKLEPGDEVIIYYADEKYIYRVTDKVVVEAEDVSWLTKDYDSETLVLQTCDPPGTTWKRLIVKAEPVV
ncbi:sortase [Patescibacteria group bacterium]